MTEHRQETDQLPKLIFEDGQLWWEGKGSWLHDDRWLSKEYLDGQIKSVLAQGAPVKLLRPDGGILANISAEQIAEMKMKQMERQ